MNILTVNLLFSTFVFWVAARIYILPKLPVIHCIAMIPFLSARIPSPPFEEGEVMKLTKPGVEYFKRIYADTVVGGNTAAMMCGHAFFGSDRMLFGTDYPYPGEAAHEAVVKAIGRMNIPAEEKEKIFSGNAKRLLKMEDPKRAT